MDNELLILLSKFSVVARTQIGAVNPAKLFKDTAYAEQIFEQVNQSGNEELMLLSLAVQSKLGKLDSTSKPTKPEYKRPNTTEKPAEIKYLYGARG